MNAIAAKNPTAAPDRYRALFEARPQSGNALTALRKAAFERFAIAGIPTQRDEDWKYTNLRRLESRNFVPADPAPVAPDDSNWIADAGARIVLVNGHWMPGLSTASPQPPGVTVLTLGHWLANEPDKAAAWLAQHSADAPSAFEDLNTAFLEDGVVINIAEGVSFDQPLYVVHHWSTTQPLRMSHPRIIVHAGRNSRCTLIEHYIGQGELEAFTNTLVSLELEAGAGVTHYRLQQESTRSFHIGNVRARLQRDSRYACHDIALGASIGRTTLTTRLEGPGAEATLRGLFVPDGTQHLDTYTLVDHVAPQTMSNEEYRGVADGRGRGVFRGKVIVRPDAQKIDSRQSSRNLLLSPTAEIDTRPELEIYANDVKCSHGATTGQLDAASLFYLRSRGLSETDARALLIRAFAESILTTIECAPVRHYLEQRLHERFSRIEVPA